MNIKDRLSNEKVEKEKNDSFSSSLELDLSSVFADSLEVRNILFEIISARKNIIFVSSSDVDTNIISSYFSFLLGDKIPSVVLTDAKLKSLTFDDLKVNICPSLNIEGLVKVFERSVLGILPSIVGFSLFECSEVLKKIKTLIAVNYKNLSYESINYLIDSSRNIFVYFDKNLDGLLYISKIEEVINSGKDDVRTIFDLNINEPIVINDDVSSVDVSKLAIEEEVIVAEQVDNQASLENNKEQERIQKEENEKSSQENQIVEEVLPEKINKYKLLKEKLKKRRSVVS